MDLSAVIFVVLALAWAVYLIPKALKHHDELASDRLVEGHSDRVRVLSRTRRTTVTETVTEVTPEEAVAPEPAVVAPTPAPAAAPVAEVVAPRAVPTRASARRAARNRRRVLGVLLTAVAVVAVLAFLAVVPWWSVAVPAALVVAFLVVARASVRRMQQARRAPSYAVAETGATADEPVVESRPVPTADAPLALEELGEDPAEERRQELETALSEDGSLWDPLPLTLPTYVGKARARRTVRTIELTGINSSGHDAEDSELAREAREAQVAEATTAAAEQRKVAGA